MNKILNSSKIFFKTTASSYGSHHSIRAKSSNLIRIIDDNEFNLRRIVMSNEKQRNSLGLEMIESLQSAVDSINYEQCRVLVITSSNHSIFSSGHNLKELTTECGANLHRKVFEQFTNLCLNLQQLKIPTVAEVHGLAAAAGCQLAASCDMIIASKDSHFSTPGVKFGVFCSTPGVALVRNISPKVAAKMLFTGEAINAHQALMHGLVSEIVDKDKLEKRVNEISMQISSNSRHIVSLGKKCLYDQIEKTDLNFAYKVACEAMIDNLNYTDTQSGLKAFASKQKPVWSHKSTKIKK